MKSDPLVYVGERTRKILKWIKFEKMGSWFEDSIILIKGAVRGKFRIALAPHTRRVFEELDKSHVNIVTMKVSSQMQKTTLGIGALMKWIDTDYHDMFLMIPRAKDIKKFIEFKVKPIIEGTPSVNAKMKDYRQDEKERKHSHFYITAQNLFAIISINDTKSITTKYGVFDEAAEFPSGVIGEAMERMKEYGNDFKALITSTQIHENDEINNYFNVSEVKIQYFLHCHYCGEHFYPAPEHLKFLSLDQYKKDNNIDIKDEVSFDRIMSDYKPLASRGAYLECPNCSSHITNKQRVDSILTNKCEWFQVESTQKKEGSVTWERVSVEKEYYESIGLDANTALAPRVPIKKLAEKEIECMYAAAYTKDTLYEKFYVGYWNKLYTRKDNNTVKRSEILLLANGYDFGVVPDNISALHIGVDLQINRLYYVVAGIEYGKDMTLHLMEYGELLSNGESHDMRDLKDIIGSEWYDKNNTAYKIQSIGCDIRGFDQKDPNSRSNELLDFIFDYAIDLKNHGVIAWDNFIHPMYGVSKFNNKTHESQGFQEVKTKRKIFIDGKEEEISINGIAFSNMTIKTMFYNMINRGVDKAKSLPDEQAYKYDSKLMYITQEAVDRANEREDMTYHERREKHTLEAHLTAEHLTYKITDGKPARLQTYEKKITSARNDYGDCVNMIIAQSLKHDTYRTPKPIKAEITTNYGSVIGNMGKVFS